jgi:hypothetical protein
MLKHATRALLAVMLLVATVGLLPSVASAAPRQCTVPEFNSTQTVYVDPGLANDPSYPEPLTGLSQALKQLDAQHHLATFVIACQEDYVPGSSRAVDMANDAIARWSAVSGFPKADALVIVFIRKQGDPNHLQIAAVGGSRLLAYGYGPQTMGDHVNGPMATDLLRADLNDPKGMIVHVAERVNKGVSDYEFHQALPGLIAQGVMAAIGAIGFIVVLFLTIRRRKTATGLIGNSQAHVNEASARYIKLHGDYFGFLQEVGTDWRARFKGITLQRYDSAVKKYTDLTVRFEVAKNVLAQAQAAMGRSAQVMLGYGLGGLLVLAGAAVGVLHIVGFGVAALIAGAGGVAIFVPMMLGAMAAIRKLTTDEVEINGDALPLDQRPLFGAEVQVTKFKADELWADLNNLYIQCNTELDSIVKAFKGARANIESIKAETAKVEELKPELTKRSLNFDPYQGRYTQVQTDQAAFVAILEGNPLEAFSRSEAVKQAIDVLEDDIRRAIQIKDALAEVVAEIEKSTARAKEVRGFAAAYAYPDGEALAGAAQFTLSEDIGNPDTVIADASSFLARANKAVLEGRLDDADAASAEATKKAKAAFALVQEVLDAKAEVETSVPNAKKNLVKLDAERPGGETDRAALKSDFIPENWSQVAATVATAKKVSEATAGELAKIKAAYFEQRYLAARNLVRNLGKDIQGSRDNIVAQHARLEQLKGLRQHAKDIVAKAKKLSDDLSTKLQANSFTTSAAVDTAYKNNQPVLAAQVTDVALPITDWVKAAHDADVLLAALEQVDSSIDAQKQAHDTASTKVQDLASAVKNSRATVENDDTREPARTKFGEAQSGLTQVSTQLAQPKSDWAAIAQRADGFKGSVNKAVELAQADHTAAANARAEIKKASEKINAVNQTDFSQSKSIGGSYKTFGSGYDADLSSAQSHLRSAKSYLGDQKYESAADEAERAYNAAESARVAAVNHVAGLVTAAVTAYEEEEERRRARSNPSIGGGGGGFPGGGGAGGGGVSGGNAGGNEL